MRSFVFASLRAPSTSLALLAAAFGIACTEGAPGAEPEYVYVTGGEGGEASGAGRGGSAGGGNAKGGAAGTPTTGGAAGDPGVGGAGGTSGEGGGGGTTNQGGAAGKGGKGGGPSKGGTGGTSGSAGTGAGGSVITSGDGTSCDDAIVMQPGDSPGVFVANGQAKTTPVDVLACAFPAPRAYLRIKLPAGNWTTDLDGDGSAQAKTALAVRGACDDPSTTFLCAEKATFTSTLIGLKEEAEVFLVVQGTELEQSFALTLVRAADDCQNCGELLCSSVNGACVGCNEETDCELAVCDPTFSYCRKCQGNDDCDESKRGALCDVAVGSCGCKVDADCPNVEDGRCLQGACFSCKPGTLDCNGETADGCEVDPKTDGLHCGSCTKSCDGAGCVAGTCGATPEVFAQDPSRPEMLTANDDALFYARANDATNPFVLEIVRRPHAGGPEVVLQSFPSGYVQGLAVNATSVVAQIASDVSEPLPKTSTTFYSFPASGSGTPVVVTTFDVESLGIERPMFLDETSVYWSVKQKNLSTSDTFKAPIAGGALPEVFGKDADLLGLTKTDVLLGFRTENYLLNQLRLKPKTGGAAKDVLQDPELGKVGTDGTHVFFNWSGEAGLGVLDCPTIWRLPVTGGKPTKLLTIATSGYCPDVLRFADTSVYVDIANQVVKAPKDGGPGVAIIDDAATIGLFALGPAHAYWVTGNGPYVIKRVPR